MKWLWRIAMGLCAGVSFGVAADELLPITYTTYEIKAESPAKVYIASSRGQFVYAGFAGSKRVACTLDKSDEKYMPAFQESPTKGLLECGDIFQAEYNKGHLNHAKYHQKEVKAEKVNEFMAFQGHIHYKLREGISITFRPICSTDSAVQGILRRLYDTDFTCDDMVSQFQKIAKDSLGDDFEKGEVYEASSLDYIAYFDDKILVIDEYLNIYTGGAHGMPGQMSRVFNRDGGELIELSTFIDGTKTSELKEVLWGKLQKISSDVFIEKSEFSLSDNVTIDYNGITFVYQPYELLAYSFGSPRLNVEFERAPEFFIKSRDIEYLLK